MGNEKLEKISDFFLKYKLIKYKKGDVFIRCDEETPPYVYYIEKGFVRVYSISDRGTEQTVNIYGPGTFFPMVVALNDLPNYLNYEAFHNLAVRRAPKEEAVNFINNNLEVLLVLARRLGMCLFRVTIILEIQRSKTAYEKVVKLILMLAKNFGTKHDDGKITIRIPFTHRDLANLLGLTRETVSRAMEQIVREKCIVRKEKLIKIVSLPQLRSLISDTLADAQY